MMFLLQCDRACLAHIITANKLIYKSSVAPLDSSSESASDSDSDSDDLKDGKAFPDTKVHDEDFDDEDSGPPVPTATYFQTKNELIDVEVAIPNIEEVGPDEVLEKVGEIMSVVGNVVIVNGITTGFAGRVSEKALDSDTLLVFEDRKVLGYVRVLDLLQSTLKQDNFSDI
jgi:H/ACA ribonucleoprotein complex non-core subunit NAF1